MAIERLATQAARRLGAPDHRPLLRREHAALGVALWRRAAAMARACLRPLTRESLQLLYGGDSEEEGDP